MKKQIVLLICCLMIIGISLQAQKRGDFDRSAMLKEKLELTDEQSQQFDEMSATLKKEMMEIKSSDLSMDEKKAKMKELGDRKKAMMGEILTPEQSEKLSQMPHHDKRGKGKRGFDRSDMSPEELAKMKEEKKAKHEEMKKFHKETVVPYNTAKRAELDKELKRKDRKDINKLRDLAEGLREEMKSEMKAKRKEEKAEFEKGDKPPRHKKKGHRGHGKMHLEKLMTEYETEFKQLETFATKYATEIDQKLTDMDAKRKEWKEEMKADMENHAFDQEGREHPGAGKSCPKGKGSCDKSSKKEGYSEEKMEKRKMMKRIGFLLMPSEMKEEIENQEVLEAKVLSSKVYPNPSSDSNTLEVKVVERNKYLIELYNENGQKIRVINNTKLNPGTEQFNVDLSDLPSGMYYYIISDGKNNTTQKFVKN